MLAWGHGQILPTWQGVADIENVVDQWRGPYTDSERPELYLPND